ncbi:RidA family protein [Psychromarinibacter halotolerans]|uniref:RidA family protein n=1 Tax=Psychromarinibacter halotolerans TaxID=1775175 RepID=A0ABV7GYF4_9RHOB|nr:RidA family protein [Psychromarinibacter halotolerans]MDF0595227.1 RidA family protein [Psychromarinibacter halotolerans]
MAPDRWTIRTGSKYEELAGYSRAVVDGEWIFVSGTAGFDPDTGLFPDDPAEQARCSLSQIEDALSKAGAGLSDIVRVRVYLSSADHVVPASKVLGEALAATKPTNTTIICGFADPEIQVEIEVTAMKRSLATSGGAV